MINEELYINGRLCDIGDSLKVRLNRVLINPAELNTKDAQYSYNITLPGTAANHDIFGYANIEETKGKFNQLYTAEYIANGVRVFYGNFRLSSVTRTQYKGNLLIPATKSIKDVFADKKLQDFPPYLIDFEDFVEFVNKYNTAARTSIPPAIFPYTLYGLLPKVPSDSGTYSPVSEWDDTVRTGLQDFPPSVNVLEMVKHLFASQGYAITGSAFNDDRLAKLYMSYKNDPAYEQPWNYGRYGKIRIAGTWSNAYAKQIGPNHYEITAEAKHYRSTNDKEQEAFTCDLFDSDGVIINTVEDPGGNIEIVWGKGLNPAGKPIGATAIITVPVSGYYKVHLGANSYFAGGGAWDKTSDWEVSGGYTFDRCRTSLKLIRNRKTSDFGFGSSHLDGTLYRNNQNQTSGSETRYVPFRYGIGDIRFVDLAQNDKFIAGIQGGARTNEDISPFGGLASLLVAKSSVSWSSAYNGGYRSRLAINNPQGYVRLDGNGETATSRYKCELIGSPENYALIKNTGLPDSGLNYEEGELNCIVWLEANERITLADVTDGFTSNSRSQWPSKSVNFDLSIEAFRSDISWLKMDPETGTGVEPMNWNDPSNFSQDTIDLVKFLPADMKADDFIDNICKAFNLRLSQTGLTTFALDLKQQGKAVSNQFVNLDNLASVRDRVNTPLGLPSLYKLGFTIDKDEQGYVETGDDGGGEFSTGAVEEKIVEQKSTFSYNWFKNITKGNVVLPLAIISKHEAWSGEMTYPEAMLKRYTNQALRFWYYDGPLNDLGATFTFGADNRSLSIAKVSNTLQGRNVLNYKNERLTILDNFFTVLVNADSHYTEVEGYLTPDQYQSLDGSRKAMFNCDLYYVAELSAYDPTGRNKTKIKLIREI